MKWYGRIKPSHKKNNNKLKRFLSPVTLPTRTKRNPLPPYIQTFSISLNNLIIFKTDENSSDLKCLFKINSYQILLPLPFFHNNFVDLNTPSFYFSSLHYYSNLTSYIHILKNCILVSNSFFTIKMKFKGKGYNIFRNKRNAILFKFGYSHRVYGFFPNTSILNFSKTSIIFFSPNYYSLVTKSYDFFKIKPINLYTGRGIRFAQQIIYRKLGKVGSYR